MRSDLILKTFNEMVDSICIVGGEACWDHARMYDVRNALSALSAAQQAQVPAGLSDDQRLYVNQAVSMLGVYAEECFRSGYDSSGEGAQASAHVLNKMLAPSQPVRPVATQLGDADFESIYESALGQPLRPQDRAPVFAVCREVEKTINAVAFGLSVLKSGHLSRCRTLIDTDPFCPACGHNRDVSSVSSVSLGDGRHKCQQCGGTWVEIDAPEQQAEPAPEINLADLAAAVNELDTCAARGMAANAAMWKLAAAARLLVGAVDPHKPRFQGGPQ